MGGVQVSEYVIYYFFSCFFFISFLNIFGKGGGSPGNLETPLATPLHDTHKIRSCLMPDVRDTKTKREKSLP